MGPITQAHHLHGFLKRRKKERENKVWFKFIGQGISITGTV